MGVTRILRQGLDGLLDAVSDRLVAHHLDRHPVVRADELDAIQSRVREHQAGLRALKSEVEGIRQALEAWQMQEDEAALTDDGPDLDGMEAARAALEKQARRLESTLAEIGERVGKVDAAARDALAQAQQARQTATSAAASAESAAEGLDELVSRAGEAS